MSLTSHSLWQLTLARFRHFFREPSAVFWTFGFPVLLSIALGLAFRNRPPDPVNVAVESSGDGQRLFDALARAPDVKPRLLSAAEAREALRAGKVTLVVTPGVPRTYTFDRTRPESRVARAVVDDILQVADGRKNPTEVSELQVTEPGGRYIDFLIPGIVGVNLMQSGMWGIAFVIVEMRTQKLLKRFVATPMKRGEFLLSFVLMRLLFIGIEVPFLLLFGWFAFGTVVRGSLPLFFAVSTIGAMAFGGIGLLVGSRAQNTSTAGGLMNLVMMPMFLFSGVFFSSANFPEVLQPAIRVLPLTALNDALRAIMNEGAGLMAISGQLVNLALFSVISFALALRIFRWQ